ncbi:MAG: glycosyltransferase family 2 protein [bacterium]|nr:glycosyltransferase family 2 protein [bacterium]
MNLAILIPALNEEKTIGRVIDSIPKNLSAKIIIVDDGSTDDTAKIAKSKGAIVVKHGKNKGLGKAFQSGLDKALDIKAEILVTIDADGQFDTKEIPKLIKPITNGIADLATGSRFLSKKTPKNMPWIKKWGNHQLARIISWATGQKFHDVSCGFRAYSAEAMLNLNVFGKFTYTQETILDLAYKGLNIVEVPVTVEYFKDRNSRIASNIPAYAYKSAKIIFKSIKNYRPLKFFGWSGIIIFLLGLGLDIFVLNHFLKLGTFSPYKIFGFMGAFLNSVGIMIFFIGILADLIDKTRITQEKILYYEKLRRYEDK